MTDPPHTRRPTFHRASRFRYAGAYERRMRRVLLVAAAATFLALLVPAFVPTINANAWISLVIVATTITVMVGVVIFALYRSRIEAAVLRHSNPICPNCGYAAGELPTCPECGLEMTPEERRHAWRDAGYSVP